MVNGQINSNPYDSAIATAMELIGISGQFLGAYNRLLALQARLAALPPGWSTLPTYALNSAGQPSATPDTQPTAANPIALSNCYRTLAQLQAAQRTAQAIQTLLGGTDSISGLTYAEVIAQVVG
jgi:hypothetical protein